MASLSIRDEQLKKLRDSLETSGQEYKTNLARLTNLIGEITSGDIQGNPADDLLARYREKEDVFKRIALILEQAEDYARQQEVNFTRTIDNLHSDMK